MPIHLGTGTMGRASDHSVAAADLEGIGAPGRTRTCDPMLKGTCSIHLSYGRADGLKIGQSAGEASRFAFLTLDGGW